MKNTGKLPPVANCKQSWDTANSPEFVRYPFTHSSKLITTFWPMIAKLSHDCSSSGNVPHTAQGNSSIVQDFLWNLFMNCTWPVESPLQEQATRRCQFCTGLAFYLYYRSLLLYRSPDNEKEQALRWNSCFLLAIPMDKKIFNNFNSQHQLRLPKVRKKDIALWETLNLPSDLWTFNIRETTQLSVNNFF